MSWFSTGLDKFNELSATVKDTVQKAIPADKKELLAKLTLNTDEMKAERQQFGDEATRKSEVKDMLAGMLPWETKDSERDILVEECKEAIMALSSNEETFFGPYEMPRLPVKVDEEKKKSEDEDEGEEINEDNDDEEDEGEKEHKPSEESLEKLAKLEPLPPLLRDFDLDSHVGLIEKLLKEDEQLSRVQSTMSGGGAREKVFWHNYFFHCAYTRYEAGLSIDEIWSFQPEEIKGEAEAQQAQEEAKAEETVVFDDAGGEEESGTETAFVADETTAEADAPVISGADSTGGSPSGSETNEFELVDEVDGEDAGDPVLDELEAEILRELED